MSRLIVAVVLVAAVSSGMAAATPDVVAAGKDPKSAKALAALPAAKKLGCSDFASASSSELPAGFELFAARFKGASIGTCTIDAQQTLLAVFRNSGARKGLETAIRTLPCLVIKVFAQQLITPASGVPAGSLSIPLVDVGSKALVFATGTAPGDDRLDLAGATATGAKVAAVTKGKVRVFSFDCP